MKLQKTQPSSDLKVRVFWGDTLYDTLLCRANQSVTIGRKTSNTFILDLPGSPHRDTIPLIQVKSNGTAELQFDDTIDGHLRVGGKFMSVPQAKSTNMFKKDSEGCYHITLGEADKADLVIGHVSFYLDWAKERHVIPRSTTAYKKGLGLTVLLITVAIAVPYFLYQWMPLPQVESPPERLVTILPRPKPVAAKAAMGAQKSADGGSQKGDPGKVQAAPKVELSAAAKLRKANLGSLVSNLSALTKGTAPSVDRKATANSATVQESTGGFTTEGLKSGGGGKSVGIGRTVGQGEGGFAGTGRLGLSGDSITEGGSGHGTPGANAVTEGLDRDVIEAIISRRQDRIRLCYERQLNFNPKLSGKITVHFVIGKTGQVLTSSIAEDTMKNTTVNSCIMNEVKSWSFPQPTGGINVRVDYPFVFESSAGGSG